MSGRRRGENVAEVLCEDLKAHIAIHGLNKPSKIQGRHIKRNLWDFLVVQWLRL